MKNFITIETCRKCGECAEVCPSDIILKNNEGHFYFEQELLKFCVNCAQCMAICPTNSVFVENYQYDKNIVPLDKNKSNYNQFYNLLAERRSVRNFKSIEVPNELISQIIESLSHMPFGFVSDSIEITIINNKQKLEESLPLFSTFYDKMKKWMHNPFMKLMIRKNTHPSVFATIKHHLLPMIEAGHYKIDTGDDNILRNAP